MAEQNVRDDPPRSPRILVGVGASAGGLDAFRRLLSVLDAGNDLAVLLVQHLDPSHRSILTELLAPHSRMRVVDAAHGEVPAADTVYVIQPGTSLGVENGRIHLSQPELHRGVRLPVDHLFRSMAREYGPRAVAVVLSGAGGDGSRGLRAVKAVGGLTIAQDPGSSEQSGMPQSAVDTGAVDLVLEIEQMPAAIERFANLPADARRVAEVWTETGTEESPPARERPKTLTDAQFAQLLAIFDAQAEFDLKVYKTGTVERRVLRRMVLAGFDDVEAFLAQLRNDESERRALVRDLLISVTEFFRDGEAFATLRTSAIDPLVGSAEPGTDLRAWVPGCATGEEAYGIAIEFLEAIERHGGRVSLQVFATDLDQDALAIARAGIYPPTIAEQVSAQRLETFFQPLDAKGYQVRPMLRDRVSFALHDLTRNPPFSRMDLVSCRNVLIYLRPPAQQHVLRASHYALNPGGFLFLGPSESTGAQQELFATVSKRWRLYRKVGASRPMPVARWKGSGVAKGVEADDPATPPAAAREPRDAGVDQFRRAVLRARVSPTIVVSEDGAIVFLHGELRPYLRFPEGDHPRLELSALVAPELATRTRAALYKCRKDQATVVAQSSPDEAAGARVRITATPAPDLGDGFVVLTFDELPAAGPDEVAPPPDDPSHEAVVSQIEKELQATREDLRNTVEELESSAEELRSANEESMSMNEELQSANEELEATTEELRSLNEELTTVNLQLREKVELLEQAHDDLQNLFTSTKIATFFLDEHLCIKRFTPAAGELLRLDATDAGRFVGDIARELLQNDLVEDARHVLEHLTPRVRELRSGNGRWIIRRVLPYRTESRRIEGVVVTFVDVTQLKAATEQLAVRERQQAVIARLGLQALKDTPLQAFLDQAVREVQQTLDTSCCKVLELRPGPRLFLRAGVGWQEGLVGEAYVDVGPDSQAGFTLQQGACVTVEDLTTEKRFGGPQLLIDHGIVSGLSCPIGGNGNAYGVLGAHTRSLRRFTPEDANFLQAVAGVVAGAVQRHHSARRRALETCLIRALGESDHVEAAIAELVQAFIAEFRVASGQLWWRIGGRSELALRMARGAALAAGEDGSVPGRSRARVHEIARWVLERERAAWVTEFTEPGLAGVVDADGRAFVSAFAFPVMSGSEVLGVVVVFSTGHLIADEAFLRGLAAIGRSLGDFAARTALEHQARNLGAITASSNDAIYSFDFDGTVTEWLPGAAALYGFRAEEMVGAPLELLVPEQDRGELSRFVEEAVRGGVSEVHEARRVCSDGRILTVSVRTSPVRDDTGRIVGVSSIDRDVSAQKAAERALVEADRQKDRFLAMLGHELRNPLAAIRNAAAVLQQVGSDPALLERTRAIIDRQSAHMAGLLDGLLDVARVASGKIRMENEPVDFRRIVDDLLADVRERLGARQLRIHAALTDEPAWVEGDRVRLAQVVDNLLSNAVKFTDDGGAIHVGLAVVDGTLVFTVEDTGVGIGADLLPELFQVFRQANQSLDRSGGGLGLGLALVRSLVTLHGGTVEAHSEGQGRGARFVVRLPRTGLRPAVPALANDDVAPMRIVLVEDNVDSAEMLGHLLRQKGHEVWTATSGRDALPLIRRRRPDVVLCDLGLPEMTGFEVVRRLRENDATRDVCLIALTGYGSPEDVQQSRDAGFDDHLTKPIDASTIAQVLAEAVRRKRR